MAKDWTPYPTRDPTSQGPDAGRVEGVLQQHVRRPRAAEQDGATPRLPGRQRPRRHHEQRLAPNLAGEVTNNITNSIQLYYSTSEC